MKKLHASVIEKLQYYTSKTDPCWPLPVITSFQFRGIWSRARWYCVIRQVIYKLISSLETGMEHLLLQPYKPCSNFLLWFQTAICQLAITKATTYDSASIESVKKHFIKIHQTHYHNFILIQSCWITSQSRFQVTKKLIKNSSLSTWTNLENTYTICKKNC